MNPIRVVLNAADPVTQAGILSAIGGRPDIEVATDDDHSPSDVVIVAADRFDAGSLLTIRRTTPHVHVPIVLVVSEMRESDVMAAVECNVAAVLPRHQATGARLLRAVTAVAAGGGLFPPALLGTLLGQVRELQQGALATLGMNAELTHREADVLRLLADGADTMEIADKLSYSERTVKNILYGLTTRLQLRNRPHAVAYAIRAGLI